MGRDENGNHRIKSALTASSIIGITFNHEWLYDSKANILKSSITDASLSRTFEGTPYMVSLAGLKFNNRSTDSAGFDQEVLKPEIGWASEILLPIRDDLGKGPRLRVSSRSPHDSILQKAFNGSIQYPLPVKTTFNKKLVEWIWNAARKGQLPAYYCMGKDSIGEQIPTKDMRDFGSSIDTVEEENGNEVVIKNEINPDLLSGLEIREEIAFHSNRFTFESKITYAAILLEYINKNTGKPDPNAENTVLYWVKLN